MSQNANQNPSSRNSPTGQHKRQAPVTDVSPDDPIGVDPPGDPSKPPSTKR